MTDDELRRLDQALLVGLTVEEAAALVERHRGTLRTGTLGGAFSADYRPNRITVFVEDGRVIGVHGIG